MIANICSVCDKPQFHCRSGWVCENGHGGAESYEADVPDYHAQNLLWQRGYIIRMREYHNAECKYIGDPLAYPPPQCKKCEDWGSTVVRNSVTCLLEEVKCTCAKAVEKEEKTLVQDFGKTIFEIAKMCFESCPEDYCIQHSTDEVIIFGGTNRLIWSVFTGWRIDEPYCTKKFIKAAKKVLE